MTERALGGNLSSFVMVPGTTPPRGFAIRSSDRWQTELVSFTAGQGEIDAVLASSDCVAQGACFGFFQIVRNDRGELYLVDRSLKQPGIRVFDEATGQELTASPLEMGLPPNFLLFFP